MTRSAVPFVFNKRETEIINFQMTIVFIMRNSFQTKTLLILDVAKNQKENALSSIIKNICLYIFFSEGLYISLEK